MPLHRAAAEEACQPLPLPGRVADLKYLDPQACVDEINLADHD
jgi:hypothetical protein